MSTFLQMRNKIEDDLNRTDLTTQVNREINRAIRKYASMPFWFSGKKLNFALSANQQSYDTSDGLPSDIRIINYVNVNQTVPTINTDTGTANTYVIATTPTTTSLSDGDKFTFEAGNANTGASTLNIDGLGATAIVRPNGVALQSGDILANQIVTVVYNSTNTNFELRDGTATYYEVRVASLSDVIRDNVNNNPGLPLHYAYFANKLYFYPIPDLAYVTEIYYQKYYADLSADGDSNDFTTNPEAEQIIEQEAEYQIYNTIILDIEMAEKCRRNRDEALKICRRLTNEFIGVKGNIKATQF